VTLKDIAGHIALVKDQLEFHERQAGRFEHEPRRAEMHARTAERFRGLMADLLRLQDWQTAHPDWMTPRSAQPRRLALTWEEIEGLPKEVLDELSISDSDRTEFNIIAAVRASGGVASLDRVIVELYKMTGEVQKRISLNQRLYRMAQKDLLHAVPGKKGVYSTDTISEEEAAKLS
jgi:hypothetical protein